MSGNNKAEAKLSDIINIEHEADAVNDKIIDKLNKTFITPIDREDIYALANGLDDGVDFLKEHSKSCYVSFSRYKQSSYRFI